MNRLNRYVLSVLILTLIVSAASAQQRVRRSERNTQIEIQYGKVLSVETVKVKSGASRGAKWGGAAGIAVQHDDAGDALVGAAAGAALGALVGHLAGGKHWAEAYVVRLADGSDVKIVTDHGDAAEGDCVAVEQGRYTNLRHVAGEMCEEGPHHEDEGIQTVGSADGERCEQAKEELLRAETEADLELAMNKVKILCH